MELAVLAILHQFVVQQFVKDSPVNESYLSPKFYIALVDASPCRIYDYALSRRDCQGSRYFIRVLINSAHFTRLLL
jgi:hypothetical protein